MSDTFIRRPGKGFKVSVAQIEPKLADVAHNLELHREAIDSARKNGSDLVVFPELSLTGYRLKDAVAEVALYRDSAVIAELAERSHAISIVACAVLENREHLLHNAALYFEDGTLKFIHRKVYLPTYGMFDEQRYFARGHSIRAFDTKHGRMAILICEDMLHPTALAVAALDGATTVIVPSASPGRGVTGEGRAEAEVDSNGEYWENYNRTMASTFGIGVIYANRTGVEDGVTFWGGSEVTAPNGSVISKASYYETDLIEGTLLVDAVRRQRIQSPVIRDEDVDLTVNELSRIAGRPKTFRGRSGPPDHSGGDRASAPSRSDDRGERRDRGDRGDRGGRGDRKSSDRPGGRGGRKPSPRGRRDDKKRGDSRPDRRDRDPDRESQGRERQRPEKGARKTEPVEAPGAKTSVRDETTAKKPDKPDSKKK